MVNLQGGIKCLDSLALSVRTSALPQESFFVSSSDCLTNEILFQFYHNLATQVNETSRLASPRQENVRHLPFTGAGGIIPRYVYLHPGGYS